MRSPGGEAKGILGHKILDREWGRVQVLEWVWGGGGGAWDESIKAMESL